MTAIRLPANDPRTIARDIPGILESLFPQLVPGVVAHFNRKARPAPDCKAVAPEIIQASHLQRAMLFEIAVAAAEQLITGNKEVDWDLCLGVAISRQRRHFDAKAPDTLLPADRIAALTVAENLASMLRWLVAGGETSLALAPQIPGYQWISCGVGDFSIGTRLIEVKCTNKHFSSADYRQTIIYWLLSYVQSIEVGSPEWSEVVLMNPRLNLIVALPFNEVITIASGGKSKVDLLELFSAMVGERKGRSIALN
jgi:hypothetical protein